MAIIKNPDGSITVGLIKPQEEKQEPAPVKRGGRKPKEQ